MKCKVVFTCILIEDGARWQHLSRNQTLSCGRADEDLLSPEWPLGYIQVQIIIDLGKWPLIWRCQIEASTWGMCSAKIMSTPPIIISIRTNKSTVTLKFIFKEEPKLTMIKKSILTTKLASV